MPYDKHKFAQLRVQQRHLQSLVKAQERKLEGMAKKGEDIPGSETTELARLLRELVAKTREISRLLGGE